MKTKLLITNFEACTDIGFWSKGLCDNLISTNDCIIRNINYESIPNDYDLKLSPLVSEISSGINTIIQYIPIDDIEYNFNYKNIIIYNPTHFIQKNLSILDKLSIADEIWVFDNQYKKYMGDKLFDKTKVIGYPYSKERMSSQFTNKIHKKQNNLVFYTITDISNIENLEILIFNFILTFDKINTKLIVYIKNDLNIDSLEQIIKETIDKIKNQFRFIDASIIDELVTIISGNPYLNPSHYVDCHTMGDCYINIDTNISPDIFTASFLGKYILSIMHVSNIITYNEHSLIATIPSNQRVFFGNKCYFNEYNIFPKISDVSIQSGLVNIYQKMKKNSPPAECYNIFDQNNFFDASKGL